MVPSASSGTDELKQARAELEDERDRFSYLFNTLPDDVIETETVADESVVRSSTARFPTCSGTVRTRPSTVPYPTSSAAGRSIDDAPLRGPHRRRVLMNSRLIQTVSVTSSSERAILSVRRSSARLRCLRSV
ncbi:hypothetical protein C8039_07930 [Halogeometricum sp. wsp3]|nr:hypothetical protein C8039_07930 [Halogeometricum sp. wsp3]